MFRRISCQKVLNGQLRPSPLQALVAVLLLVSGGASQMFNQNCTEDMTACSCPKSDKVCYFEFSVERLITFTRYVRDAPLGSAGKSYFINDSGELEHIPLPPDITGCNDTNCTQANTADGATYRTFIGINGRLPGPTLVVYEGQTVVVNVINTLVTESITMHWHGLDQFNTPWMDGAEIITQCPIAPGTSFRYIFKASQAGTFWYHSHSGFQRGDGLAGGLVVKDGSANPKYPIHFTDIPEEHTVTLLDWQRQIGTALFWKGLSRLRRYSPLNEPFDSVPVSESSFISTQGVDNSGVGIIPFWSVLINGMGKHSDLDFKNSRLKVFSVERGHTYRFRLIGIMGVYALRFSIDAHRLTVIATDGNYIQPVETDYVILHSGERYDVLITANQTAARQSDFWIRAETLEVNTSSELPPYEPLPGHEGLAVLHYRESAPIPVGPEYANIMEVPKNCSEAYECTAVNCPFMMYQSSYHIKCINVHELQLQFPFPPDLLPSAEPDIEYVLNFAFEGSRTISSINARAFLLPVISPQIFPDKIDTASVCNPNDTCEDGCLCTNILDIPYNKTVRLVLSSGGKSTNQRKFTHPIHLHGHDFQVVAVGYGKYNETTGHVIRPTESIICAPNSTKSVCINPSWSNIIVPTLPPVNEYTIAKDTVILPALGYVVIDFRSTNPGWWFLHCHMWPHVAEGMALVINEAQERSPPPPKGICDRGNFAWTVEEFNKALNYTYTPPSPMPSTSTTIAPTTMATQSTGSTAAPSRADEECDMLKHAFAGVATVLILFLIVSVTLQSVVIVILTRKNACRKPKNNEEKLQVTAVTDTGVEVTQTEEVAEL